jgi:hypothetical protein
MQTILAVTAIDKICDSLVSTKTGRFCYKLFQVLTPPILASSSSSTACMRRPAAQLLHSP